MATNPYTLTGSTNNAPRFSSGESRDAVSEREQLANFISMITRDETPFMSDIGKGKASGVYHEWQTDELIAPRNSRVAYGADFDSVRPQGDDGSDNNDGNSVSIPRRTRLGNYTQINAKTVAVSGTKRAVDQAGVADEYAYQLKKRGVEMRRDIEHDLIHTANTASAATAAVAGSSGGAAPTMGTYRAWINSNLDSSTQNGTCKYLNSVAAPGDTAIGEGTSTYAPAHGTGSAGLQLLHVDEVMQAIYENGGKATKLMMSPQLRRDFSALAQASGMNTRRNIDEKGSLRQSIDMYMSDFGEVMVVPNYIMGLNNVTSLGSDTDYNFANEAVLVYDSQWFSMATLRPMQEVDVGQKGDSTVGMFVEEQTFEVRNPYGCGAIYGLGQS